MEQHLQFEALGILRQTKLPPELAWLSDDEKSALVQLLLAGDEGLHKREVKKIERSAPDFSLNLNIRGLAFWDTDKAGRPMFLRLTWKGEDAAKLVLIVAKHQSRKAAKVAEAEAKAAAAPRT